MATLKCDKCDWKTTKPTIGKAKLSLNMHIGRQHGAVKPRRGPRLPRVTGRDVHESEEPQPQMHFCPQCGFNLAVLAKAVALANRVTRR